MLGYRRRPLRGWAERAARRAVSCVTDSAVHLAGGAIGTGVVLTGLAGAWPGSQGLNPLTWLGTVATVAALLVALGILDFRDERTTSRTSGFSLVLTGRTSFSNRSQSASLRVPGTGVDAACAVARRRTSGPHAPWLRPDASQAGGG